MKESTTYQLIIEEGGIKEARSLVLRIGRRRFGPPPQPVVAALEAIADLPRLEQIAERLVEVSSWEKLIEP